MATSITDLDLRTSDVSERSMGFLLDRAPNLKFLLLSLARTLNSFISSSGYVFLGYAALGASITHSKT